MYFLISTEKKDVNSEVLEHFSSHLATQGALTHNLHPLGDMMLWSLIEHRKETTQFESLLFYNTSPSFTLKTALRNIHSLKKCSSIQHLINVSQLAVNVLTKLQQQTRWSLVEDLQAEEQ